MRNSRMTTITDILLLAVGFIIFIQTLLEIKDTILIKQKLFKKIFQNYNLGPIMKIGISRNICDEENEFKPFFNFTFQGTKSGSYNKQSNKSSLHSCESTDLNCVNIQSISKHYLSIWDDKAMCLKRMNLVKEKNNFNIVASGENCGDNFKLCGKVNQYGDKFCVKSEIDCPINYIGFSKKSEINLNDTNYDYILLEDEIYMVISNKIVTNELPIDFIVNENYPCLEVERISYNLDYSIYPLMQNYDAYGCNPKNNSKNNIIDDGLDRRYKIISEMDKNEFYFDNDMYRIYSSLPNIDGWKNDIDKNKIYFYNRSYITPNFTCTDTKSFEKFQSKIDELKLMKYIHMSLSLANIFILCFFVSLLSLVKIIKRLFHTVITFIKILICTAFITYSIIQSYQSIELTKYLVDYINTLTNYCTDSYVVNGLNRYEVTANIDNIDELNLLLYYYSIFYCFVLSLQIVRMIYKIYIRVKNRNRRKDARQLLGSDLFEPFKNKISIKKN